MNEPRSYWQIVWSPARHRVADLVWRFALLCMILNFIIAVALAVAA